MTWKADCQFLQPSRTSLSQLELAASTSTGGFFFNPPSGIFTKPGIRGGCR
jgi:hypothetical protein